MSDHAISAADDPNRDRLDRLARRWPWLVVVYFAAQALLRLALFPILSQDEAQQVLFSQNLRLGYDEQPALYTWVVYHLFQIFGVSIVVLTVMKALLLSALHLFTFATLSRLASPFAGMLGSIELLLIPQIGWGMQRDLTHSILLMAATSAFVFFLIRLPDRKGLGDFVGLSLAFAVGLLAKPNFLFGAGIAVAVMLSFVDLRRRVNLTALVCALAFALALAAPSYLWLLEHVATTPRATETLGLHRAPLGSFQALLLGLYIVVKATVLNLFILIAAWMIITKAASVPPSTQSYSQLFLLTGLLGLLVTTMAVLASGTTDMRSRYLLPFLYFLVLWAPLAYGEALTRGWQRWLFPALGLIAVLSITVSLAIAFRFAPDLGMKRRLQAPFGPLAQEMEAAGCRPDSIIAPREFIAGNLRYLYPDLPASASNFVVEGAELSRRPVMARWAWDAAEPLESLVERIGFALPIEPPREVTAPMLFHQAPRQETMSFAYHCEPSR